MALQTVGSDFPDMNIDFFLHLETLPPTPPVWACRILECRTREHKWKTVIVDAAPVELDADSIKDHAEAGNKVLELAARHVGCDISEIRRWPLCVHVGDGSRIDRPFESQSWGELYPTLHSAQTESSPCEECRRHLPWKLVHGAGLASWRALWHGFSHGYVELDVAEKQAKLRMSTAKESEKRHLLAICSSRNSGRVLQEFHALAEAESHGAVSDMELEQRWLDCANGNNGNRASDAKPRAVEKSKKGLPRWVIWLEWALAVAVLVAEIVHACNLCTILGD